MFTLGESTELIGHYRLPSLAGTLTRSHEETLRRAAEIEGPLALKAISTRHTHKAASGLLRLNLLGAEQVARASAELRERAGSAGFEGLLVQPMVSGGVELFLGALVDPQFGPLVAFGPGGSLVELVGGVDFLRPPFSRPQAISFLERNPVSRLLPHEDNDRSSRSVESLATAIEEMAVLISEHAATVRSVDINPLVLLPEGPELIALDLRVEGGGTKDDDRD